MILLQGLYTASETVQSIPRFFPYKAHHMVFKLNCFAISFRFEYSQSCFALPLHTLVGCA